MNRIIILILLQTLSASCLCAQEWLIGNWQNEHHSRFTVEELAADGQFIGSYTSASGTDGSSFPLHGKINMGAATDSCHAITFSVNWGAHRSITSWTGTLCKGSDGLWEMHTLWHLVRPQATEDWERIITNSSKFVKVLR